MNMNLRKTLFAFLSTLILTFTLSSSVFAFTYETYNLSELVEPGSELAQKMEVSSWAKAEIDSARENGLLTENTSVYFTKDITRAQFAELIVNMVEKTLDVKLAEADKKTFTDTSDSSILKAYEAGIVNGTSATTFEPNALITREQMASMLYRAISYIETEKGKVYLTQNSDISAYKDANKVSSWAKESVGVLANNEIMKGTSAITLSPKGNATIEQSIILVNRIYSQVK